MKKEFHMTNRTRFYEAMKPASLAVMFAGVELRKTNDEFYPFFADRSFIYLTGIEQKESVLLAVKEASGAVSERLYLLPPDPMAERWTGRRPAATMKTCTSISIALRRRTPTVPPTRCARWPSGSIRS